MALLLGILDDHNNTDVIMVIDYQKRIITSLPRDLYSLRIMDRINAAYIKGGISLFKLCVADFGFQRITDCICIPIDSCREVLNQINVSVPIVDYAEYYYPTAHGQPLEIDKKKISFAPPGELLVGERIHQFIGARTRVNSADYKDLPDLERITRQQIFMQALIKDKFDFSIFLNYSVDIQAQQLARFNTLFNSHYQYGVFNRLKTKKIDNKLILLPSYVKLKDKISYALLLYFKRQLLRLKILLNRRSLMMRIKK
jgi:hypothetical protein